MTDGRITVDGVEVTGLPEAGLVDLRRHLVAFRVVELRDGRLVEDGARP